jgi:hypothetical protein
MAGRIALANQVECRKRHQGIAQTTDAEDENRVRLTITSHIPNKTQDITCCSQRASITETEWLF